MGDERNIFLSTMPATRRDRMPALAVVGVSAVLFACAVPFAGVPLTPVPAFVASYQSALAINDLITAVLLFSQFAISRSRALLLLDERIFVHGHGGDRPRPQLSRPVRARRAARRGNADHRLALHGLARRISAAGPRLCAVEGKRQRAEGTGFDRCGNRCEHRCGQRRDGRVHLARHRPARPAADPSERRPLHARHAGGGLDGMVPQPRRAGGAVARAGRTPCSTSG